MYYKNMIADALNINIEVAESIMNRMSVGGFRFSSSSEESILEEASFLYKYFY